MGIYVFGIGFALLVCVGFFIATKDQ